MTPVLLIGYGLGLLLFGFGVLLLFVAAHLRRKRLRAIESSTLKWRHNGFNAGPVSHRLNDLRRAHATKVHARQLDLSYQLDLLSRARQVIRSLPFFQKLEEKSEKD